MRFGNAVLFGLCLWAVVLAGEAQAQDVGSVDRARGVATAAALGGKARPLSAGSDVAFEDVLRTGTDSRLFMTFIDGSTLMMGDRSELIIDAMVYSPGRFGAGALRLKEGVFRMVSGAVNKVPGGQLTLTTPMASIGVRGTDFWGEQTATRLLMALLDDGELVITTRYGTVTLTDPTTAVVIEKGQAPGAVFPLSDRQLQDAIATISW